MRRVSKWLMWVAAAALVAFGVFLTVIVIYGFFDVSVTVTCGVAHGQHAPLYAIINGQKLVCR